MSDEPVRPAEKPRSVVLAADKARAQRVARVTAILEKKIDNPLPLIDALMGELAEGAPHGALWEQLHAAAARDGQEAAVKDAYQKCIAGARMKRLRPQDQAEVLMHAADYFMGVIGDPEGAELFLTNVLEVAPGHLEAFTRLERRLEKLLDARRLLEIYASVAASPPKPAAVLATQVFNRVLQLPPKEPLPEETCKRLLVLVPTNPRVLEALDTHCRGTKRPALAAALFEQALADPGAPAGSTQAWRHRLVELYTGEAAAPDLAMPHLEEILKRDPADEKAFRITEKLLSSPKVGSRAAAALREARRARGF